MLWIDIIKNIIYTTSHGLIFSAILATIFYASYQAVVRGRSSRLQHKIIDVANVMHTRSYNNRVDAKLRRYREVTAKTGIISTMVPLIVVMVFAYLFYNQILFFAVVGSGSMEPTLMTGDLVLIQNIHAEPQTGDIIMFKTPTVMIPVIHRVVGVSGSGFKTKGDARKRADDWVVSDDQIRGEAVIVSGKPVVIKRLGEYFIESAAEGSGAYTKYGKEYGFVKKLVQSVKSLGLVIFLVCILLYIFSAKE